MVKSCFFVRVIEDLVFQFFDIYMCVCVCVYIYNTNKRIFHLGFNILHTKISSHKFLISLKYPLSF